MKLSPTTSLGCILESRHKPLTNQHLSCYSVLAFSERFLRALFFCPAPKIKEAPSLKGAFVVPDSVGLSERSKISENIVSSVSTVSPSLAINTGDDGDDVSTDFRSTTTRKPDAIFEH